jgi:hypothetical protein
VVSVGAAALLAAALALAPLARAGEAATAQAGEIAAAIGTYNQFATTPLPVLTGDQMKELLKGKVVKIRRGRGQPPPGLPAGERPERIFALAVVDLPRRDLWIAALDPHFTALDAIHDHRLERRDDGSAVWYQYFALPWPLTDRHWMLELRKNPALADTTGGAIWEQSWKLLPDGLPRALEVVAAGKVRDITLEQAKKAVYTPVNEGEWVAVTLSPTRTLLAYFLSTSVGGNIPDTFVADFAHATIEKVYKTILDHAINDVASHYVEGHEPLFGGDGKPIPFIGGLSDAGH